MMDHLRLRPVAEIKLYRNDVRCAICKSRMSSEHPQSVRDRNPHTFRMAWMHTYCQLDALHEIVMQPASSPIYRDRLDEYATKFT